MRWEIERYVRVYRRDTAKWALVPWRTKAFFWELLRKADLDGRIELDDMAPAAAVVALFRGTADDVPEVEKHLEVLLADGCVRDVPGDAKHPRHLFVPNYRDAQAVAMTGAERTKKWREQNEARRAAGDGVTGARHARHANDNRTGRRANSGDAGARSQPASAPRDESDARDTRAEPSRAEPTQPSSSSARHREDGRGAAAAAPSGDPLSGFRRALADELAVTSAQPFRVARPERAEALRRHVERLGLEHAVQLAADHAREVGTIPKYADWFLDFLAEQETPVTRARGENPKPGDPDFNDPAAWRDYGDFLRRDDGKGLGFKPPVYKPPLTPEEEAEQRAKTGGRS
jgi:hypothetical protein